MRTTLTARCTTLIGRARAALRRRSLQHKTMGFRRPAGQGRMRMGMRMELLDLELFRNDIGG